MILAVMFSISVEARQPFSSSTVTTSTLVCSASKCSRAASSPSFADTTTDWGTPAGKATQLYYTTVEPLNKGRVGTSTNVHYLEVVLYWGVLVKHLHFKNNTLHYSVITVMIEEEKAKIQWLQYWSKVLCVSVDPWYATSWSVCKCCIVVSRPTPNVRLLARHDPTVL